MSEMREVLLSANNLSKDFNTERGQKLHAVSHVTLDLYKGETLALVGESGCGKSTLGRTLIRLLDATDGTVEFQGKEITHMKAKEVAPIRRKMQMVFQDPYASLDPRMKVRDIIAEPLMTYKVCASSKETTDKVLELMGKVGVPAIFKPLSASVFRWTASKERHRPRDRAGSRYAGV